MTQILAAFLLSASSAGAAKVICSVPYDAGSPDVDIAQFCRSVRRTCVVDLTPLDHCRVTRKEKGSILSIMDVQGSCPDYGWNEMDGVFIFGPKDSKRSRMAAPIGPVKTKAASPRELLKKLVGNAELRPCHAATTLAEQKKREFRIKKGTLQDGILQAARQLGPSFWSVRCSADHCSEYVDDYADLDAEPPPAK